MPATLLHMHNPIMITLSKAQGLGHPTPGSHTKYLWNWSTKRDTGPLFYQTQVHPKVQEGQFQLSQSKLSI